MGPVQFLAKELISLLRKEVAYIWNRFALLRQNKNQRGG